MKADIKLGENPKIEVKGKDISPFAREITIKQNGCMERPVIKVELMVNPENIKVKDAEVEFRIGQLILPEGLKREVYEQLKEEAKEKDW